MGTAKGMYSEGRYCEGPRGWEGRKNATAGDHEPDRDGHSIEGRHLELSAPALLLDWSQGELIALKFHINVSKKKERKCRECEERRLGTSKQVRRQRV